MRKKPTILELVHFPVTQNIISLITTQNLDKYTITLCL